MAFSSITAVMAATAANEDLSNGFVILMGLGTVFVGLLCIVILSSIMSVVIRAFEKKPSETKEEIPSMTNTVSIAPIANRQEFIAAVSACIAEELGTDVSGIRIVSVKAC